MFRRFFAAGAVIALLANLTSIASAQNFGTGSSAFRSSGAGSGGFGSSSFGSGGFGSSGFGSSGFGSSGFGGSRFGSGGFGSGGFGSGGFGNGFGSSGFGNSGFGNSFGNTGFGNSMYGGGQSFVGRDAADMQGTFSQMGRAGAQFFNQMNRNMNRNNNRRNQANIKTIQNPAQPARIEVKVAFDTPKKPSDQLAADIRSRVDKILSEHRMGQASLSIEGDTAVVRGVANSDTQRDVITQLLSLEPGIRDVRNEMTVVAPASAAPAPAPDN